MYTQLRISKRIQWFTNQVDLKDQKARWAEILQEYDACLRYCKGQYNVVADALSRMRKKGLYKHGDTYSKERRHEEMKDPSHSTDW